MKKLSELSNDTMLIVGNDLVVMTKEEFLDSSYFLDCEDVTVTIGDKSVEKFTFSQMIEEKAENNHEDWDEAINRDITSEKWEVLRKAEKLINEIFEGSPTYWEGEKVDIELSE